MAIRLKSICAFLLGSECVGCIDRLPLPLCTLFLFSKYTEDSFIRILYGVKCHFIKEQRHAIESLLKLWANWYTYGKNCKARRHRRHCWLTGWLGPCCWHLHFLSLSNMLRSCYLAPWWLNLSKPVIEIPAFDKELVSLDRPSSYLIIAWMLLGSAMTSIDLREL